MWPLAYLLERSNSVLSIVLSTKRNIGVIVVGTSHIKTQEGEGEGEQLN